MFHDENAAQEILSASRQQSNILQAVLFSTEGKIISHDQPGSPNFENSFKHAIYTLSWQSIENYRKIYMNHEHVYLLSNLQPFCQRLHDLTLITILAMILSYLLGLGISIRLQKSIFDPIVHLTRVAT